MGRKNDNTVAIVLLLLGLAFLLNQFGFLSISPFTNALSPIREWEYGPTETMSVSPSGTRLFAPVGNVMRVWDISNPTNPIMLTDIQKAGNTIGGGPQCSQYVVSNDNMVADTLLGEGVVIINSVNYQVSRLSYPKITGLAVYGSKLYVGQSDKVSVIDLAGLLGPSESGSFTSIKGSVFTNGSIIATHSCSSAGVVSFSDMNGVVFKTHSFGEQILDVAFNSKFVIISGYNDVWFYDPTTDTVLGTFNNGGYAHKVAAYGDNYIAVSSHDQDVQMVDITNPSAPVKVGTYFYTQEIGGYPRDLQVFGNYFALATLQNGVALVEITIPSAPTTRSKVQAFGRSKDATLTSDGKYAYVLDDWGLRTIDMTGEPASVNFLDFGSRGSDIAYDRNAQVLYCAVSWGGLKIVDVSTPTAPILLQDHNPAAYINTVTFSGNRLYLFEDTTFKIFDRIDPKHINAASPLGTYTLSGRSVGPIVINGNYAYVGVDQAVVVLDISNPTAITQTATLTQPYTMTEIEIKNNVMYVFGYIGHLQTYELTTPDNPTLLYTTRMQSTISGGFAIEGSTAYAGFDKLAKLDISNPSSPSIVEKSAKITTPNNLEIVNGYMIGTWEASGVKIFQVGTVNPNPTGCDYDNPPCTAPQTCQSNVCVTPTEEPPAEEPPTNETTEESIPPCCGGIIESLTGLLSGTFAGIPIPIIIIGIVLIWYMAKKKR